MPDEVQIHLAETIRALRRELIAATKEGEDAPLRFALGPVNLELQLEIGREVGGEAGVAFWVVTIGGKGSRTSSTTHTIKLTLTPVGPSGKPDDVLVSGESDHPA